VWIAVLTDSARCGRSDMLRGIQTVAPAVAAHMGPAFAIALEDAVQVGSREYKFLAVMRSCQTR
jgi:hypothetical protein